MLFTGLPIAFCMLMNFSKFVKPLGGAGIALFVSSLGLIYLVNMLKAFGFAPLFFKK